MPTWCGNLLTVVGPRDERDRLVELWREPEVFERTLPTPLSFSAEEMRLIGEATTTWLLESGSPWACRIHVEDDDQARDLLRIRHWGTRSDTRGDGNCQNIHDDDEATRIIFDTAYSPPVWVIRELSRQYPTLAFRLVWDDKSGDTGRRSTGRARAKQGSTGDGNAPTTTTGYCVSIVASSESGRGTNHEPYLYPGVLQADPLGPSRGGGCRGPRPEVGHRATPRSP